MESEGSYIYLIYAIAILCIIFGVFAMFRAVDLKSDLDESINKVDFLDAKIRASEKGLIVETVEWNVRQNCFLINNSYFAYDTNGALVFGCRLNTTNDTETDKYIPHTLVVLGNDSGVNLSEVVCGYKK